MDVGRRKLRRVSDKLMRQFAPAVSTLVADDEEEEDALIEQPMFVERIHGVFSNLGNRKPELAAFLLEERNFEHYCLSLWHKYCGVDNARFEEFLTKWEESEPVSDSVISCSTERTSLTTDLSFVQTAEAKAAEDALLASPLEGRTSERMSTSLPTELSPRSSSTSNDELTISDPIKPQPEEEDFWSAPAPENKGGLSEPEVEEVIARPSVSSDKLAAPSASVPPETLKEPANARLAMLLSDLDEDVVVPPKAVVSAPLAEPKPLQANAVSIPETSLQLYRRLVKDMAARESFSMDQLKFLLRMRTEKGISEADHMGVLADLGITSALFARYIKNGQKGWIKPVVAGAALLGIVMDLAARLVASEDPSEQVALARELVDAKRAVDEDRKANPISAEEENIPVSEPQGESKFDQRLAPFSAALLPIAAPLSHPPSNGTIVLVPVQPFPSSSSSSSAAASAAAASAAAASSSYNSPPPAYNPALSSSTSLFTASSSPSSAPILTQRAISVPAVSSSSSSFSCSCGNSETLTRGSVSGPPMQRKTSLATPSSTPPPPPTQRTSLFSVSGASTIIAPPPSPLSSTPVLPSPSSSSSSSSSTIPQRPSLFAGQGASQIAAAPPPPLRIPSTPSVNTPFQQTSPLSQVRNGSLTPLPLSAVVAGGAGGGTLNRSSSGLQIQTPSSNNNNNNNNASPISAQRNLSLTPSNSNNNNNNGLVSSPSVNRSLSNSTLGRSSSGVFDPPPPAYEPPPYGAPPPGYGAPPSYNAATASPSVASAAIVISKDGREYWTIVTPIRIRDAPSTTGNPIGKLDPGYICVSTQRQGSWFCHSQGWSMYESDGKILARNLNPDSLVAYQPALTLRVRSAPLPTAPEVGFLHPGQTILALEIQGYWMRHETGWSMITSDPAAKGEKKTFLQRVAPRVESYTYYEALLQIRIRQQPKVDGQELGVLTLGQVVRCLEMQGLWLRHDAGWSLTQGEVKGKKTNFMQQTSSPPASFENKQKPIYEVVEALRVRSAPSATASEVGTMEVGQRVRCLEIQGSWLRHDQGWSMLYSDPSRGDRRAFMQPVGSSPLPSPSASPSPTPPASPGSATRARLQLEPRQSQSNVITYEVVSPVGLRVRDSPSEKGKEMCLLQPGQIILGTEVQGSWVRHSLGWSMISGVGKKGEKLMFLKPK